MDDHVGPVVNNVPAGVLISLLPLRHLHSHLSSSSSLSSSIALFYSPILSLSLLPYSSVVLKKRALVDICADIFGFAYVRLEAVCRGLAAAVGVLCVCGARRYGTAELVAAAQSDRLWIGNFWERVGAWWRTGRWRAGRRRTRRRRAGRRRAWRRWRRAGRGRAGRRGAGWRWWRGHLVLE